MHPGTILTYNVTDKNYPNGDSNGDFMKKRIYAVTPRDVGGIGDLIFDTIQFPNYQIDKETGLLIPVYHEKSKLLNAGESKPTGDQLLCSLYNFYDQFNMPDCTASKQEMVRAWCLDNVHPYNLRELYFDLTDKEYSFESDSSYVKRDGVVDAQQFMDDCAKLYHHYSYYLALEDLKKGKQRRAFELNYEGRETTGYDYFERYKWTKSHELPDLGLSPDASIVEEMQAENAYWEAHPDEKGFRAASIETYRGFATSPLNDLDELYEKLIDGFPTFRMCLDRIPQAHSFGLLVQVDSVFDIAWYAFASYVTMNSSPNEEYGLYKPRVCKACQNLFIPNGPRAEYCDEIQCQRSRKRKNRRDCNERKREQTISSRAVTERN